MEGVVPDLSTTGLNHDNHMYSSMLPHDDTMNVFDFQNPDIIHSLLPTDFELAPHLPDDKHCLSCSCGTTASTAKASVSTIDSNSSVEDRLDSVVELVQNAGFRNMDDMIISYYTTTFDDDSNIFYEQRMSRKRGLPTMLSRIRSSTAGWHEYEREAYESEILKNAESLLVGECRRLSTSATFKERLAQLRSGDIQFPTSSSFSTPHDSGISSGRGDTSASQVSTSGFSHPKDWLSEELPNVWELVSALSGCRPGSQSVAAVLLTLSFADHLRADEMRLLLESIAP